MLCRKFNGSDTDEKLIHDICYGCGDNHIKNCRGYLQTINYFAKQQYFCDIFDEVAFFAAVKNKKHIRLIAVAVLEEHQRKGYGRRILFYEMQKAIRFGLREITFRTSIDGTAINFWTKLGARITGRSGQDWEMKLQF